MEMVEPQVCGDVLDYVNHSLRECHASLAFLVRKGPDSVCVESVSDCQDMAVGLGLVRKVVTTEVHENAMSDATDSVH